jgi:oligoendopeptidase F
VRWDLTPLAPSEQVMKERLESAVLDASSFIERWPIDAVRAIAPSQLADLLRELAGVRAAKGECKCWASMLASTDGDDPLVLDVQAWVDARLPFFDDAIRHFELAWAAIPDEVAQELVNDDALEADRHYLGSLRRFRPFLLSPPEERVLAAREASASTAWQSLHARTLSTLTARFDDGSGEREWSRSELELVRRSHPRRELRRRATETLQRTIEPFLPLAAQCYDALVADRLALDRLRGHPDPIDQRNLDNEIEGGVVETLLAVTEERYALAHRWFRLKARLLGLDRLDTIDLFASAVDAPVLAWDEGRRLTVGVFANLTSALGNHAEAFFDEQRIDAEPRHGKTFGAYCEAASTRVPAFVFVNWAGSLLDLTFLTHELGHGTHFALAARAQSDHSFMPGLTIAEVPSTFAEVRLVDDLQRAKDPLARPALAMILDAVVVAVFIQTAFARYEQQAYALRAEGQALTAERLSELFDAELGKVWGDAMTDELGERRTIWARVPHFIIERFYTYAYVFAFLLATGLLPRSRNVDFGERYERFLAAGNSGSPEELVSMLGVDLNDREIWNDGFAVIEDWLDQMAATVT